MRVLWRGVAYNLVRFPSLLVAIVVVAVITAVTAAAGPLFLASTEVGSLREGIRQATRWTAGYQVRFETFIRFEGTQRRDVRRYFDELDRSREVMARRFAGVNKVEGPLLAAFSSAVEASTATGSIDVRLIHRDGAYDHVDEIESSGRDGIWIADAAAEIMGVGVGDSIRLRGSFGATTARVSGIYRHLAELPPAPYWSPYSDYVYRDATEDTDPPPLVIVDRPLYESLLLEIFDFDFWSFDFPLESTDITFGEAREVQAAFTEVSGELNSGELRAFGDGQSALGSILARAEERLETVTPVVDLLSAAARIVALAVAAAAGFYLVKRRRIEATTLAARGIGPLAQGLRYGAEATIPLAVGIAAGTGLAWALVSWLGPARNLALSELERAGSQIATTSAGALAVLIASASLAAWREEVNVAGPGQGPLRSRWLQLGTLAAIGAGVAAFMARDRIDATDMEDPLLTLVPIAMILAGGVAAATIVLAGLPRLARRLRYSAPPMYLAVKRLSGASGMTRLLVVAGAWALGVAVYGFTMSSSVDLTTTAKAKLFIGSDFSALVGGDRTLPDVPQPVTHVVKVERAPMTGGGDVGLMGVDPETFAGVAFWDPAFSDRSLDDLVAELEEGKALSTADLGPSPSLARSDRQERFEVAEVVDAFPGMLQERPTVIMSQERLDEVLRTIGGTTSSRAEELWGKGDGAAIENALREQGFYFDRPLTAELVLDTPGLTSLLWMLGLLAALGAAASLIAIAGLLLYLQARQRTALVSSALTRRMGLSGPGEFSSWLGEIAGALLTSFLAGIAVGLPVANLMSSRLDPRPNLMPPPLLVIPAGMLIGLGAVLIVVSLLMSWRVKRIADRADIAEVMRT